MVRNRVKSLKTKRPIGFFLWWATGFSSAVGVGLLLMLYLASVVFSMVPPVATLDESFKPVDLIVCLTGGRGRIRLALEIFDQGVGRELYISGVDPSVKMRQVLREIQWIGPLDESRIFIDTKSTNTIENAQEVLKFALKKKFKSILVVTSVYHARRAHFVFEKIFQPHGIQVQMVWFELDTLSRKDWWKSANGIFVTVTEYFKFFYTYWRLI